MLCVQLEVQSRKLFLWKIGVHDQKEKVFEMRRCNEALVTNMLPEHVAKHFLGTKKRDEVNFSVVCGDTLPVIPVRRYGGDSAVSCASASSCGCVDSNLKHVSWSEY